jgi:AcrR family transcriptional regulator
MARKYVQVVRAEAAAETRRRLLDALTERLRGAPTRPISLDQVARDAGVARSTVYLVFGSRAGLFVALVQDLWERTGIAALTEAVAHPDVREHLREGFRTASQMFANERDVWATLWAMARLDPEGLGPAVALMEQERAGGMAHLANRLRDQDVLRPELTVEEAADVLWVLTSFEAYDLLATRRGLGHDEAVGRLIGAAERSLCR